MRFSRQKLYILLITYGKLVGELRDAISRTTSGKTTREFKKH